MKYLLSAFLLALVILPASSVRAGDFYAYGGDNFLLNPYGGRVGIGITSPLRTLDVNGTVGISSFLSILNSTSSSVGQNGFIRIPSSQRGGFNSQIIVGRNHADTGDKIYLRGDGSFTDDVMLGDGDFRTTLTGVGIFISDVPSNPNGMPWLYFGNPDGTRPALSVSGTTLNVNLSDNSGLAPFRASKITSDHASTTAVSSAGGVWLATDWGNVGVGTTTPSAKFALTGNGATTGLNFRLADSNDKPLFTVDDQAEITIGTNAIHNAVINSPESLVFNFDSDNTAGSNVFKIGANGTGLSRAVNYFAILDGGNVGIGTTVPQGRLQVTAGANATTTIEFGSADLNSKTCFNAQNTAGESLSFYFVGTSMVVENNRCRP